MRSSTQLLGELRIATCKLRCGLLQRHWNAPRQRGRGKPIIVWKLPVDLGLQQILSVLHRQNIARLIPVDHDAQLRIIVTEPAAYSERALCASQGGNRELCYENYSVGCIESSDCGFAEMMLAVDHRYGKVLAQQIQNRSHGSGIEQVLILRTVTGGQRPHSAGAGSQHGIQE